MWEPVFKCSSSSSGELTESRTSHLLPVCFYHFSAALVRGLASLLKLISQQGIPSFKALVSDWQSVYCSQSCTSACCPLLKLSGPLHACTICMDIRPLTTSNQYHFCIGCWQFLIILEYFRVTSGMQQYWPGETALKNGLQLLSSTQKVIDYSETRCSCNSMVSMYIVQAALNQKLNLILKF